MSMVTMDGVTIGGATMDRAATDEAARETLKALGGFAFLEAIKEGRLPQAPMADTLDFALTEVEEGRVVFRGRPRPVHYNPFGTVHGGWFATLLDSCIACAVLSALPKGSGCTTLELKVNLVRAMTEDTGAVEAEGKVVQVGRQVGVAEGRLTDREGRLLGHGTSTCLIVPV